MLAQHRSKRALAILPGEDVGRELTPLRDQPEPEPEGELRGRFVPPLDHGGHQHRMRVFEGDVEHRVRSLGREAPTTVRRPQQPADFHGARCRRDGPEVKGDVADHVPRVFRREHEQIPRPTQNRVVRPSTQVSIRCRARPRRPAEALPDGLVMLDLKPITGVRHPVRPQKEPRRDALEGRHFWHHSRCGQVAHLPQHRTHPLYFNASRGMLTRHDESAAVARPEQSCRTSTVR